jgi:hypothetical protein
MVTAWQALRGLGPAHLAGRCEELTHLDRAHAEPGTTISITGLRGMRKMQRPTGLPL